MAPVTGAERAALDAFFKGKRGERVLIEHPPARGLGICSVWPEAPFAPAWTGSEVNACWVNIHTLRLCVDGGNGWQAMCGLLRPHET